MALPSLHGVPWALKVLVAVALLYVLSHVPFGNAIFVVLLVVLGAFRLRGKLGALMNAKRLSWRWTALVLVVFLLVPLGAGHGVAPIGLFLIYGWEHYGLPTLLAWLGVLTLAPSPFLPPSLGGACAFAGVILLFASVVLIQTYADDPLLAVLCSVPFLICLTCYSAHLWRVRLPAQGTRPG